MRATGIVRRLDNLGRIVIPKEIRRSLHIREADPIEIFTDHDGMILLKKYSPIGELAELAQEYADSMASTIGETVLICDLDTVIAASGGGSRNFLGKTIHPMLERAIENRKSISAKCSEEDFIPITGEEIEVCAETIRTIICQGDAMGAVCVISQNKEKELSKEVTTQVKIAADFISKQMET